MKILLIVPPFATTHCPSTALSTLKAILTWNNFDVEVIYSNFLIKKKFIFDFYERMIVSYNFYSIGEYIFSDHAFCNNKTFQGKNEEIINGNKIPGSIGTRITDFDEINEMKKITDEFLNEMIPIILSKKPKLIGFSLTFQQICSTLAIANLIKRNNPEIINVIGGFNCQDPMGKAITAIGPSIDYAFSGEADLEFLKFCQNLRDNILPEKRIINCTPLDDLNELPYPDYSDYFAQIKEYNLEDDVKYINFESSRGCWWKNASHCVFCGINNAEFRTKNVSRIRDEIHHLVNTYNIPFINTTDSILAKNFPEDVFKDFKKPEKLQNIFYEIKPFVKFDELRILKSSGMNTCQPGIETLNDELTRLLNKGTITANNIRFLRDCKILDITPIWNFLFNIPGEKKDHYTDMIDNIIPYIDHLQPPVRLIPLMIHRYSPIFENPEKYNIENLKPIDEYFHIFPENADIGSLAYYFKGEYKTAFDDKKLRKKFFDIVSNWIDQWKDCKKPSLKSFEKKGKYIIQDTRKTSKCEYREINTIYFQLLNKFENPVSEESVDISKEIIDLLEWKYVLKTGKFYISMVCK